MTRATIFVLLILTSAAGAAGVDDAERVSAKARNQYYEALRAGNPADPARAAQLRQQILAPANATVGRAMVESRQELRNRMRDENRRIETDQKRLRRDLEAKGDPKDRPRAKGEGKVAGLGGAGAGGEARPKSTGRGGETREEEVIDGTGVEKVVDMKDAARSAPRWKRATTAPKKEEAPSPSGEVRRTDEQGVGVIDFSGDGEKKK